MSADAGGRRRASPICELAQAIRERAGAVLAERLDDGLDAFRHRPRSRSTVAAELVAATTRTRYPDLRRSRCTAAGGTSTPAASTARGELDRAPGATARRDERARARIDLWSSACCSTPAPGDSGATASPRPAASSARSEGLAVASFHMFMSGALLRRPDAAAARRRGGLRAADATSLAAASRSTERNPLVGLDGRAALLRGSATRCAQRPTCSATTSRAPGHLLDAPARGAPTAASPAADVLAAVLDGARARSGPGAAASRRRRSATCGAIAHAGGVVPAPARAASQALAVADLLAARAAASGRRRRHRPRRADRPGRVPQRRPVRRRRRAGAARDAASASRAPRRSTSSWSSGARSRWRCSIGWRRWCAPRSAWTQRALPLAPHARGRHLGARAGGSRPSERPDGAPPIRVDSDGTVF